MALVAPIEDTRLVPARKAVYALGDFTVNTVLTSLAILYFTHYLLIVAGLRPELAGAVQLIGQSFELVDPIVNGRGSIKTGDTIWRVEGPELPRGTRIKVVGADGTVLKVVPV